MELPAEKRRKPKRPNWLFRSLLRVVSIPDLMAVRFRCQRIGMERLGKREPCLYLMNHSSFVDLEIAATVLFPRPFHIVTTEDGFIGKNRLMYELGCIPTKKFVSDIHLIRDMTYAVRQLHDSVLMYPEASYSFDGTATALPESIGGLIKRLGIPVVMIRTHGAFARDPLYNNLQRRKVRVSADVEYLLSPEQIRQMSGDTIQKTIEAQFRFDYFRWQSEQRVCVNEPFRADCLHRVLYKCPHCMTEGQMEGKGISVRCRACGKTYLLDEYGILSCTDGTTAFSYVSDWYAWERRCVREELLQNTYRMETEVDICVAVDTACIYRVGEGILTHDPNGFRLVGCDGQLEYSHSPISSYGLYSDFNWYEVGDVICIGNQKILYYCFPKRKTVSVAKARLAAEELYRIVREQKRGVRCI